ncbi:hypothetical protein RND81_05G214600 [Saponaria officinalis]|uniref:Uncharacterized protein n=1 Tax=Saponaria officinalis TaxID=3572 RepID=A0AAW1KUU4_SAPOF
MTSLKRHVQALTCNGSSKSTTTTSYIRMNKKTTSLESFYQGGSSFFKHIFSKIRYKWKQYYLKRQLRANNVPIFSYDAHSYAQNFDSGCRPSFHRSPFAP